MLAQSSAVVVGTVEGIENVDHVVAGAGSQGLWFTNLRFRVESYVFGAGPETVYVRHLDDLRAGWDASRQIAPKPGERVVLFLIPTKADGAPSPLFWAALGYWSRLDVDENGQLTYLDGGTSKYLEHPSLQGLTDDVAALSQTPGTKTDNEAGQ